MCNDVHFSVLSIAAPPPPPTSDDAMECDDELRRGMLQIIIDILPLPFCPAPLACVIFQGISAIGKAQTAEEYRVNRPIVSAYIFQLYL